jgi:polyisoprenoid-binding protein YceI
LHQAQAQRRVLGAASLVGHGPASVVRRPFLTVWAQVYMLLFSELFCFANQINRGGMTTPGQPTASALQALVQDGSLTGSWVLDPARSEVLLQSRHTWGLRPLHGVFRQVTGNGTVTADGQVTGILTVAAGSIDTRNKMRDKDLRSAKLFDIANHPDITYTVDGIQPASEGVRVTGSLNVRGRTRPLSFDAKVSATADEVRLDAEVPVNRADFGLTYRPLRMASLDNIITVHAVFTRR